MAQKTYESLQEGELIDSAELNLNFTNLSGTINSVAVNQLSRNSIDWDSNDARIKGVSFGTAEMGNPVIGAVVTSTAKLEQLQTRTLICNSTASSRLVITDASANNFVLTFTTSSNPDFTFRSGDAIRYWFEGQVISYNSSTGSSTGEFIVIHPQVQFAIAGITGSYLNLYPTPSGNLYGPAAFVGSSIAGNGSTYITTRTAADTGRGPGAYRSVMLEGIIPISVNNTTEVNIRMVYYGTGSTPANLRFDLSQAIFQGVLLRNCFDL